LSVRAFCEREGLEPWNFHWWRQALARRDREVPPARTVSETVRRFEPKVTVRGEEYVIVDIGLRMLSPPELYRAQGFLEGHSIAPEIGGKPLRFGCAATRSARRSRRLSRGLSSMVRRTQRIAA
jgi:hypothetical protein